MKVINGEKVVEAKEGKLSFNGEVVYFVKTEEGNFYECTGEYLKGKVTLRSYTLISKARFENPNIPERIKPSVTPKLANPEVDQEIVSSETYNPVNHFEDARYFGNGKLHKVLKDELGELAETISGWVVANSVPKDAILKTFDYMSSRFENDLTAEEIKEFTIDLLNIRREQFEDAIGRPQQQEDSSSSSDQALEVKLPEITVVCARKDHGYLLSKVEKTAKVGASKIGGYPDLTDSKELLGGIDKYYFVAQINTQDLQDYPQNQPQGLLSFFIENNFTSLDYYKAKRLKLILTSSTEKLSTQNMGQAIFDESELEFEHLKVDPNKNDIESQNLSLDAQFLPDLAHDSFVEQLVYQSYGWVEKDKVAEQFPEIVSSKAIEMIPLMKLKGSDLRISNKSFFDAINVVFFVSKDHFNLANFDYCYYVVEPY